MITAAIWCVAYALSEIAAVSIAQMLDGVTIRELSQRVPIAVVRIAGALFSPTVAAILLTIAVNR